MLLDKIEKLVKENDSVKLEGTFSILLLNSSIYTLFPPFISKFYDFSFKYSVFVSEGKHGSVFWDLETNKKTSDVTFDRFMKLKEEEELLELSEYKKKNDVISGYYNGYINRNLGDLSDSELYSIQRELLELHCNIYASTVYCDVVDEEMVKAWYKKTGGEGNNFKKFFQISSTPTFFSFVAKMNENIIQFKEGESSFNELSWLFANYYINPSEEEIKNHYKNHIEESGGFDKMKLHLKEIKEKVKDNQDKFHNFKSRLPDELKKLIEFINMVMHIRDIRKEPLQKVIVLISIFTREIFKRKGMDNKDAIYANFQDFISGNFNREDYEKEIEKRKKGVTILVDKDGTNFDYSDSSLVKNKIYEIIDGKNKIKKDIKGSIGSKGKVEGRIKIIMNENDFNKFKEGEVLVTSMTRPEFVPLMKKSVAIITDEGGITCHAAIVSRELKIPCIIGTKNATRILKDGDLVEVDADEGVVRILEKNS